MSVTTMWRQFGRLLSLTPRQSWEIYRSWWSQDSVWWGVSLAGHALSLVVIALAITALASPAKPKHLAEAFDKRALEAMDGGMAIAAELPETGGDGGSLVTSEELAPDENPDELEEASGGGMFDSTDQPLYGGLGGFDVSAPQPGPAIEAPGGVGAGIGAGISPGNGGDGEGMGGGGKGSFVGTGAKGRTFVYVVDCSESMLNDQRFERARTELLEAVGRLSPEQRFFVILFNDNSLPMDADAPVPATKEEISRLREWLGSAMPATGTVPLPSLLYALGLDPDAIYFLSDGEFDPNTLYELRAKNRGSQRRKKAVPIHTISLGNLGNENLMKIIARISGGKYRYVK
jgi:hypothetical protein